jgi:biopolymer transport protein TolR
MAGVMNGNGGRRGGRARMRPNADINITPMVDVMLVLLIIFMVTAPSATAGVAVGLPKTRAKLLSQDKEPLTTIEKRQSLPAKRKSPPPSWCRV